MTLTAPEYSLAHALACLDAMKEWPFAPEVPPPTRSALIRAKELVLAAGPLVANGPQKMTLAPSLRGGVVVTFYVGDLDITFASMNNYRALVILGKGWTGELRILEMDHAEAIERVRDLRLCSTSLTNPADPSMPLKPA